HRAQGAADQTGDLVGAAPDPALDALAGRAGVGRAGEHRVLRGDPAGARTLLPARHALGEGGGAQHAGAAELDQHAALGVVAPVPGEAHLAQLLGRATVGTVGPGRLGTAGGVAVGVHGTASGHQGWVRSSGQKDTSRISIGWTTWIGPCWTARASARVTSGAVRAGLWDHA